MKRLLPLCFAFVLCAASAAPLHAPDAPVTIDLQGTSLAEVLHLVYRDIQPGSYVLAPELVQDSRPVSLRWSGLPAGLPSFISTWLETLGYSSSIKNGVLFVSKTSAKHDPEPDLEELIYHPRHQPASFLRELSSGLVAPAGFTSFRGIAAPASQQNQASTSAPAAAFPSIPEKPGTAASLIDKDDRIIVFRGVKKDRERLEAFLSAIDKPSPVVNVQGAIFEVNVTRNTGSAFSLAASILGGRLGATLGPSPLSNQLRLKVGGIEAVMSALSQDSRFKVLSAPRLSVRSGGNARLTVGQEVPTAGAVTTNAQGGTLQSVEYKQSGVIFDLSPHVFAETVRLTLSQQVSSFVKTDTGVNNSPTLLKREAKTDLDVSSGEVVVIGGLVDSKETESRSGLSFLPSWMGSDVSDSSRSELLVLLQVSRD